MKPRINVYLNDDIADQLQLISKRPGTNKSRIVNDALDQFFNPEKETSQISVLIRRLDHMSRSMQRLDRNQSIGVETLALFIRYFLTITPPLPETDQAAAHALGKERFEVFVAQVGRRLAQDQNLLSEVLETIAETRPDLFTSNPDHNARPETIRTDHEPMAGTDDVSSQDQFGQDSGDMADLSHAEHGSSQRDGQTSIPDSDQDELPPLKPVILIDEDEFDPLEDWDTDEFTDFDAFNTESDYER